MPGAVDAPPDGRFPRNGRAAPSASALFVVSMLLLRHEVVDPYLDLFLQPFWAVAERYWPGVIPVALALGAIVLTLPQLAVALAGGLLFRMYKAHLAPDR